MWILTPKPNCLKLWNPTLTSLWKSWRKTGSALTWMCRPLKRSFRPLLLMGLRYDTVLLVLERVDQSRLHLRWDPDWWVCHRLGCLCREAICWKSLRLWVYRGSLSCEGYQWAGTDPWLYVSHTKKFIKTAVSITSTILKNFLVKKIEDIIDKEREVTHDKIAAMCEEFFQDATKISSKLDSAVCAYDDLFNTKGRW